MYEFLHFAGNGGPVAATKRLVLTAHARTRMHSRRVKQEWIERTVQEPDWTEPDPTDPAVERRFRAIAEAGGRILRVPCVETESTIRVKTVLFDKSARRMR